MSTILIVILVLLFVLSILGLWVGVGNDAVNFLSSAVGSKAASLKWIFVVASVGIMVGVTFSSGMMEIPRNGIFLPEYFYLYEVLCIFLATVVTNVILLDIFNSLGLPTSTSVSMVFELLGAAFAVVLLKHNEFAGVSMVDMLNTDKAFVMIIGIFVSVAIAFVFGSIVQWIARFIFTFTYNKSFIKIGIFSAIAITAIVYFLLFEGVKGSKIVDDETKTWMSTHVWQIIIICFVGFSALTGLLQWLKVNVLKIVVLLGTFALALAFAGNDLVNFIGVTVAATSSCQDFAANGAGYETTNYLMTNLNDTSQTSPYYMLGAGVIMTFTLIFSKKSRKVLQTSIDLSRQSEGDELFGSSTAARRLVRFFINASNGITSRFSPHAKEWVNERFTKKEGTGDSTAAFDLLRASVNLVIGSLLIALGTSMKLPLSTTYVTFMVGMGTSLADRAWGRESAVFRITGVISVIGGWIITAVAAFLLCGVIAMIMMWGGYTAMIVLTLLVIFILIRNDIVFRNKKKNKEKEDVVLSQIMEENDKAKVWNLLQKHAAETFTHSIGYAIAAYQDIISAFEKEDLKVLRSRSVGIIEEKGWLKQMRRKEINGCRRIDLEFIYEKNTYYYLCTNNCQQIFNTLLRICEPLREHVDNNFTPLPQQYADEYEPYSRRLIEVFSSILQIIATNDYSTADEVSSKGKLLKHELSDLRKSQLQRLQTNEKNLQVDFIYLNLIQESHELLSEIRNVLRGSSKFFNG